MRTRNRFTHSKSRGSALLATMVLIVVMAMLLLSMLATGLSSNRSVTRQEDEMRLTGVVERAGNLAAQYLWSTYLRAQGGAAGDVASFRMFLDGTGITSPRPVGLPHASDGRGYTHVSGTP